MSADPTRDARRLTAPEPAAVERLAAGVDAALLGAVRDATAPGEAEVARLVRRARRPVGRPRLAWAALAFAGAALAGGGWWVAGERLGGAGPGPAGAPPAAVPAPLRAAPDPSAPDPSAPDPSAPDPSAPDPSAPADAGRALPTGPLPDGAASAAGAAVPSSAGPAVLSASAGPAGAAVPTPSTPSTPSTSTPSIPSTSAPSLLSTSTPSAPSTPSADPAVVSTAPADPAESLALAALVARADAGEAPRRLLPDVERWTAEARSPALRAEGGRLAVELAARARPPREAARRAEAWALAHPDHPRAAAVWGLAGELYVAAGDCAAALAAGARAGVDLRCPP